MPKPNFFGGHKFSIPYGNQSRAVKRFGCFHSTPNLPFECTFPLKKVYINITHEFSFLYALKVS